MLTPQRKLLQQPVPGPQESAMSALLGKILQSGTRVKDSATQTEPWPKETTEEALVFAHTPQDGAA